MVPEHSYFGHGKGFWRSNSFSVQLRIRKQKELIRKRREIDFTSRELSRNFITAVMCLLSSSLTFLVLLSSTKIEVMKVERLLQSSLRSYYANPLLPSRDHTSTPERICWKWQCQTTFIYYIIASDQFFGPILWTQIFWTQFFGPILFGPKFFEPEFFGLKYFGSIY